MLIYQTLAGSRLYGYHNENSDYDYRGVFLAPKQELLGLIGGTDTQVYTKEKDVVNYELRRFCHLALKGNPNILEILFSCMQTECKLHYWQPFYENRHAFLSQQIRNPYKGFLLSEIKKLEKDYKPKAAANAWRLAVQCGEILENGDFNPTLSAENRVSCAQLEITALVIFLILRM